MENLEKQLVGLGEEIKQLKEENKQLKKENKNLKRENKNLENIYNDKIRFAEKNGYYHYCKSDEESNNDD
jgi:cell division protein FtsB